jgi:hypothetical protein
MATIVAEEFIHACYVGKLPEGGDAVIVKMRHYHDDGTVTSALVPIEKPSRSFFTTKQGDKYRTHAYKKEVEAIANLDRYEVPNYKLAFALDEALNGKHYGTASRPKSIVQLSDSPYVYGADIHIECLIKHKKQQEFLASGQKPVPITTGFFDIETDVVNGSGDEPNIITITHENKVYTGILETFFTVKQADGSFRPGDLTDFIAFSKTALDQHITQCLEDHLAKNPRSLLKKRVEATPFEYHYYVGKTPLDLIRRIFTQMHKNKTDFIGIWNLAFDIQKILTVLDKNAIPYADIFCPPELPQKYRYARYVPDEKETDNIFKKWHWLHNASYAQFVDSMCLYSILRTVKGKETKMSLDHILKINDLGGKLTFKDDDPETEDLAGTEWHRYMQKNEAYKYIVYNQFDCISLQLMEWKNDDLNSMFILGGVSRLCKWNRQTRKVADALYFDVLEDGLVTASPGTTMETEFDRMIGRIGGTVLRPERTTEIGLKIFSDMPDIVTMLHNMAGDVDFTSMYPTATSVCNISKETKISTGLTIGDKAIEATHTYYSQVVSLQENAIFLGQTYFGLKGYEDTNSAFSDYLKTKDADAV